jgi:hypothetical protein
MSRKKKFFLRQIGLLLTVVGLDVSLNILLTPTDQVNGIIKESLITGFLVGTVFAFIADRVDIHYQEKEA